VDLESILHEVRHELACDVEVVRYSSQPEFEALWDSIVSLAEHTLLQSKIIIFDGFPDYPVTKGLFRPIRWLTPWDWCSAASLRLKEAPARITSSGFRVFVMDCLPGGMDSYEGRIRFKRTGALMPWIRWYRPLSGEWPLAHDYGRLYLDLKRGLAGLPKFEATPAGASNALVLAESWRGLISGPLDRHSVANLIGPSILARGWREIAGYEPAIPADNPTKYLLALLDAVGYMSPEHSIAAPPRARPVKCLMRDPAVFPQPSRDIFSRFQTVRLKLIDDQYKLGYDRIVAHTLFGVDQKADFASDESLYRWTADSRNVSLSSSSSPWFLIKELETCLTTQPKWQAPRLFGSGQFDILLLDLRLFSDSTLDWVSEEEVEFLEQLLAIFDRTGGSDIQDPQLQRSVSAARRRINGGKEDICCLSFLPLLLSHADPSLPVLLFSSTHQRYITEACAHRPNLITSFSKPVLSGYAEDGVSAASALALRASLVSALRLHESRVAWEQIAALKDWGAFPEFEVNGAPPKSSWPKVVGADLVDRISEHYRHYILGMLFREYQSVPWEFLEATLTPDAVLDDPEVVNPRFYLSSVTDSINNRYGDVFRHLRNRKVHGHTQHRAEDWTDPKRRHIRVTILLFLMFVNFIARSGGPDNRNWDNLVLKLEQRLRSRHSHLDDYFRRNRKMPVPASLTTDSKISWNDFALLVMVIACRQASRGDVISKVVGDAIERLVDV
jgi:hypothetical protein